MSTDVDDFLAHYGVKGMKWGVRKETPSISSRSASGVMERIKDRNLKINTQRRDTINARISKTDVRIAELKSDISKLDAASSRNAKGISKKELQGYLKYNEKARAKDLEAVKKEPNSGLTSTQKKVLIGMAVVAALGITAYGVANREDISASVRTGMNKLQIGDVFKKNDAFTKAKTPEDVLNNVVKGINPNYKSMGGSMNCRRTTFAYELRRRGYDVTATTTALGRGQSETGLVNALIRGDKNVRSTASLSSFAKSLPSAGESVRVRAKTSDKRVYDAFTQVVSPKYRNPGSTVASTYASELAKAFSSQPNGARGEIAFNMRAFIHSMQYEVFDGVPHIFDSQKANHYPVTAEGLEKLFGKWGTAEAAVLTRLDNVDLDLEFLSKWVTDRV